MEQNLKELLEKNSLMRQNITQNRKKINDMEQEIQKNSKLIYKLCQHQWNRNPPEMNERTSYSCKICGSYKNYYM